MCPSWFRSCPKRSCDQSLCTALLSLALSGSTETSRVHSDEITRLPRCEGEEEGLIPASLLCLLCLSPSRNSFVSKWHFRSRRGSTRTLLATTSLGDGAAAYSDALIHSLECLPHVSMAKPAKLWAFNSCNYHWLSCQNIFSVHFWQRLLFK